MGKPAADLPLRVAEVTYALMEACRATGGGPPSMLTGIGDNGQSLAKLIRPCQPGTSAERHIGARAAFAAGHTGHRSALRRTLLVT